MATGDLCGANIFTACVYTYIYWKIFSVHLLLPYTPLHTHARKRTILCPSTHAHTRARICVLHWTCAPNVERFGCFQNGVSLTPNRGTSQYIYIIFVYTQYTYILYRRRIAADDNSNGSVNLSRIERARHKTIHSYSTTD